MLPFFLATFLKKFSLILCLKALILVIDFSSANTIPCFRPWSWSQSTRVGPLQGEGLNTASPHLAVSSRSAPHRSRPSFQIVVPHLWQVALQSSPFPGRLLYDPPGPSALVHPVKVSRPLPFRPFCVLDNIFHFCQLPYHRALQRSFLVMPNIIRSIALCATNSFWFMFLVVVHVSAP